MTGCIYSERQIVPCLSFTQPATVSRANNPLGIAMSNKLALRQRDMQIEALKVQREHLRVMRDRHQTCMKEAGDIDINRIRHDIIDLIEKTLNQYDHLLEALRTQGEGG